MEVLMKSFIENIYINRDKESNWDLEDKAKELGFKNIDNLIYTGMEVCFETEFFEDGTNKVLSIDGIDVSEKNISI
jgi:hypothetical protein